MMVAGRAPLLKSAMALTKQRIRIGRTPHVLMNRYFRVAPAKNVVPPVVKPLFFGQYIMAIDAYLQIDGIKGESADSVHQGWIE